MRRDLPDKPRRRTTKRITFAVIMWAMLLPVGVLFHSPDQFGVAIGAAVTAMVAALGTYQTTGHMDYRAGLNAQMNPPSDDIELPGAHEAMGGGHVRAG